MRLQFDAHVIDLGARTAFRDGRPVRLSPKAFELLELLATRRPDAVSKEEIHRKLWPDTFTSDGSLANLVSDLREALDDQAHDPRVIRTVPRYGYALQDQVESVEPPAIRRPSAPGCFLVWADREIRLDEGENLMGRDPDAVVVLDDISVSRYHARIVIDGSAVRLEDLGSKNGSFVRGQRLATAPVSLRDGDPIRLGAVVMIFHRAEVGPSTQTASRQ